MDGLDPAIDFVLDLIALSPVTGLQPADQFVTLAFDDIEVIVGELAPLLSGLALDRRPIAFYSIPVHCASSVVRNCFSEQAATTMPDVITRDRDTATN
jgi:hypothetical protein